MSWALCLWPIREPELADAFLLSVGKALYISNSFEGHCKHVLQFLSLGRYVKEWPEDRWDEGLVLAARDKWLGATIKELAKFPAVSEQDVRVLEKARDARNFIAHEGAMPGYLWTTPPDAILEHADKLRGYVRDLAAGDHLVSCWVYELDEGESAGTTMAGYPQLVERWIFDGLLP